MIFSSTSPKSIGAQSMLTALIKTHGGDGHRFKNMGLARQSSLLLMLFPFHWRKQLEVRAHHADSTQRRSRAKEVSPRRLVTKQSSLIRYRKTDRWQASFDRAYASLRISLSAIRPLQSSMPKAMSSQPAIKGPFVIRCSSFNRAFLAGRHQQHENGP